MIYAMIAFPLIMSRFISDQDRRKAKYNLFACFPFMFYIIIGLYIGIYSFKWPWGFYLPVVFYSLARIIWEICTIKMGIRGIKIAYVLMISGQVVYFVFFFWYTCFA